MSEDLRSELDEALRREAELRASLVDAHRQRLESEDRLNGLLDAAAADSDALRAQRDELLQTIEQTQRQALAEQVRRERLERTPPLRLARGLAALPPFSLLRARRARGFQRELDRARDSG
jgi:predicted  nucleic acid-binding Zn-ribbon protein